MHPDKTNNASITKDTSHFVTCRIYYFCLHMTNQLSKSIKARVFQREFLKICMVLRPTSKETLKGTSQLLLYKVIYKLKNLLYLQGIRHFFEKFLQKNINTRFDFKNQKMQQHVVLFWKTGLKTTSFQMDQKSKSMILIDTLKI